MLIDKHDLLQALFTGTTPFKDKDVWERSPSVEAWDESPL